MAKITITYKQLEQIYDLIGDVEIVTLEEGNGGNIDVIPDGSNENKFTLSESGEEL